MDAETQERAEAAQRNQVRAEDADAAVKLHSELKNGPRAGETTDADERLVDLLTDLRHWAHLGHVDFARAERLAADHFAFEMAETRAETKSA